MIGTALTKFGSHWANFSKYHGNVLTYKVKCLTLRRRITTGVELIIFYFRALLLTILGRSRYRTNGVQIPRASYTALI